MMSFYFDDTESLDEFFKQEDVLDGLNDYSESGGKHDCTDCHGYHKDANGDHWGVGYSCSYNEGVQGIYVDGPYEQYQETVVVNKYKKKEQI